VYESDLVAYVGSLTGGLVTRNWSIPPLSAAVMHIDINPENLARNYPHTIGLCGDARTVLRQLLAGIKGGRTREVWLKRVAQLKADWLQGAASIGRSESLPIRPERLARELSLALPENAIVVGDTGHSAAWLAQFVEASHASQSFIRCHGSLGWSFPAALGAQCAAPDRPVICFCGDGSFYYHLAELETAARYGINVVTVLNDNAGFSQEQALWSGSDDLAKNWKFKRVDFVAVAQAFGCEGIRVTSPSELRPALVRALEMHRPVVIDVATDDKALALTGWGPEGMPALFSNSH
jgi:acetolactate synthase-1/2/3 large subunit